MPDKIILVFWILWWQPLSIHVQW